MNLDKRIAYLIYKDNNSCGTVCFRHEGIDYSLNYMVHTYGYYEDDYHHGTGAFNLSRISLHIDNPYSCPDINEAQIENELFKLLK